MYWCDATINLTQFPSNFQGKMQYCPFKRSDTESAGGVFAFARRIILAIIPIALFLHNTSLLLTTQRAGIFLDETG